MSHALRPELLPRVVERFKALADESRLRLLLLLKGGPANVTDLARRSGIAQASVSKHLAVLRMAGLVDCRRVANRCIHEIKDDTLFDLCGLVCDGVLRQVREEHAALGLGRPANGAKKGSRA